MTSSGRLLAASLLLAATTCLVTEPARAANAADVDYYQPGITAADLLRRRGYLAEELYLTTSSGYVLRLTRGLNPLLERGHSSLKAPVLFVHGTRATANSFLLNSFGARPKDFTQLDLQSIEPDELIEMLADEPSSWSLPLLASNCGHEIWFVDRRGRPGSQELKGDPLSIKATPSGANSGSPLEAFMNFVSDLFSLSLLGRQVALAGDHKFWNFSLDEQANEDFPQVIDFILDHSRPAFKRVAVVGHSAGAALPLMALSLRPAELGRKLSRVVLWSASYARGNGQPDRSPAAPVGETPPAPKPAPYETALLQASQMLICAPRANWQTICESTKDAELGDSGQMQPMRPQYWAGLEFATSARELAQLNQSKRHPPNRTMHFYDFGPTGNQLAYGRATPPAYDLAVVSNFSLISLYAAATDSLATPADIEKIRQQLRVPHEYHLINTTFNHIGYFFHLHANRLAVIPSMHEIGTARND